MAIPAVTLRLALNTILYPTDFSPASDAALPYVRALVRWYGPKVIVVHAARPDPPLTVPMEVVPAGMNLNWEAATSQMDELVEQCNIRDLEHETLVQQGSLWEVVSAAIERYKIDMIVLGTHGREGLKKVVLGSAAEEIFRRSTCPVLTVGPHVERATTRFEDWKHIVFATDFSPGSLNALPYALSLAEENQAKLILVHFIPLVPLQRQDMMVKATRERLEALVPLGAEDWCKAEYLVRFEYPADGIVRVAQEHDADLIVMGVHPSTAPRASTHLLWATAYEVVCHAPCPVLTVRG